jgi:hypothetical protein
MADINVTPNMNLPTPTPGEAPGPDWAESNTACFYAIDSHNHSAGQGVPITPAGIDVNTDLPLNENNLVTARSVNFVAQAAPLALADDIGCLYVSGDDLYYNDEAGNQVRITQGGSVTGATGTITGLPSGTASASFAAATFTFQSATNTPATMAVGPLVVGAAALSPKTVTLAPNVSQPGNYAMTFPLALPASTSIRNCDNTGQEGFVPPDNATFGVNAGAYKVLPGGIGTTQIANLAVTNAKLALTNYLAASFNGVFTTSSTSFVTVTGLSVDLTCLGTRPIMLAFTSRQGSDSTVSSNNSLQTNFRFLRDGALVTSTSFAPSSNPWSMIPCWTAFDLTPTAGVVTYLLQVSTNNASVNFTNPQIVVMEL